MAQQHPPFTAAGDDNNTIDITVHCLCKKHTFTASSVPVSSLPLKATSCHCDSCRYATGALYSADVDWPGNPAHVHDSDLQRYVFTGLVSIMFCGKCGSKMFFEMAAQPGEGYRGKTYAVFTGALPNVEVPGGKPLVAFEHHMFLGDTKDGGASPWLKNLDYDTESGCATATRRWHGKRLGSEEIPHGEDWPSLEDLTAMMKNYQAQSPVEDTRPDKQADITIPIKCKCGGVQLELLASAARDDFAQIPRDKLPRFVDPDNNKPLASFDVCDSCRIVSGLDIFHWTFSWLKHIAFLQDESSRNSQRPTLPTSTSELQKAVLAADGERDARLGTLKTYASSPDVQRYFCGQCSAVVFYACDDLPDQVDIALGLLRAPVAGEIGTGNTGIGHGGARAEHFLSWKLGGSMAWQQDVKGGWRESMMHAVGNEAASWRDKRGLAKNWRVRNDEKAVAEQEASA